MFATREREFQMQATRQRACFPLAAPEIPTVTHEHLAALFRRLTFDISGDPLAACVLFCEHPPSATIGRHGSGAEVRGFPNETIQYVARGGPALPHGKGQLGIYPVLPLDAWRIGAAEHVSKLLRVVLAVVRHYGVAATIAPQDALLMVGTRPLAAVGVAIHRGVCSYGMVLNVNPDLESFAAVRVKGASMTSLIRESPHRVLLPEIPNVVLREMCEEDPAFPPPPHSSGSDSTC